MTMDHDQPELRAQAKQLLHPARNPETGEVVEFTPDGDELAAHHAEVRQQAEMAGMPRREVA